MRAAVSAGGGFLLAVLWFDLMFDAQVLRGGGADAVDSIAAYYRRVTTDARPMNRLISLIMLATVAALVAEVGGVGDVPRWAAVASLVLAVAPITVAATRTVKRAVRLGARTDPPEWQMSAARVIGREHVFCVICIATLLVVQLASK